MQTIPAMATPERVGGVAKKGSLIPRFTPFSLVWTSNEVHTENMNCVITFSKPLHAGAGQCAISTIKVSPEERGKGLGRSCAALFLNEACE